jgi:hypothetical protein
MTDRATVLRWLAGYEAAWRAPGTEALASLFAADASYLSRGAVMSGSRPDGVIAANSA